jgi:uncharacterized protein YuzE
MKITYDPEVDILRIVFTQSPILESDDEKSGVILDYDAQGNIVGLEVLAASTRMDTPWGVEFGITKPDNTIAKAG